METMTGSVARSASSALRATRSSSERAVVPNPSLLERTNAAASALSAQVRSGRC